LGARGVQVWLISVGSAVAVTCALHLSALRKVVTLGSDGSVPV